MVRGPQAQSAGSGGPWPPYEVEADEEKRTAVASNQTPVEAAAAAAVENEVAEVDSSNDTPPMMETKKVVEARPEQRENGDGYPRSLDPLVPRSVDS